MDGKRELSDTNEPEKKPRKSRETSFIDTISVPMKIHQMDDMEIEDTHDGNTQGGNPKKS